MSRAAELQEGWQLASRLPVNESLRVYPTSTTQGIFACVDSGGRYGLLVELRDDETVARVASDSEAGITCGFFPFGTKESPRRGMLLLCRVDGVVEAFAAFGETLIEHRLAGASASESYRKALGDFKKLLSTERKDVHSVLVGLLGELVTLERLTQKSPDAVDAWMYPDLERHDFRQGTVALEVKTTLRSRQGSASISISAFDQLEPPVGGDLYLRFLQLERNPAGEVSVTSLMKRIESRLAEESQEALRIRVSQAGLGAELCNERFSVLEMATYEVAHDFPRLSASRLLSGQLDAGIRKVKYELDLGFARQFLRPHEQAEQMLLGVTQ